MAMKRTVGWAMSAGLLLAATAAGAQSLPPEQAGRSPLIRVSDFNGAYAAMPPEPLPPNYAAPGLLPPQEVYTVLRDNGFSPLGAPRLRGFVYGIAVIDRSGERGRLVIDARDGRIQRFMPEAAVAYGLPRPMPPMFGRAPRPPGSIPHVASRTPTSVPLPKEAPRAAEPPKAEPRRAETPKLDTPQVTAPVPTVPTQQSASAQVKPAETAPQTAAPPPNAAKPSVQILPTQVMPKAQGLD